MTNGTFSPVALSGTVYGIAGAGISLGLLAGMARGISNMTWGPRPTVRPSSRPKVKSTKKKTKSGYPGSNYRPRYAWG